MSVNIAYASDIQSSTVIEFQNIIYKAATNIFDGITPQDQVSKIAQKDVSYTLNNLVSVVNPKTGYAYLTESDGYYIRRLITSIEDGMRDILKDSKITISDAPSILKMIKDIILSINEIHNKKEVVVQISRHTFIPIVQTIILLTSQMILTQTEYDIAKSLIQMGFQLIETNIDPIAITKKFTTCLGSFKSKKA